MTPFSDYPAVRVVRLFSHREMVRDSRRKYLDLPEVRFRAAEAKKKSSFRTNREEDAIQNV
jgi:hypothetical protein